MTIFHMVKKLEKRVKIEYVRDMEDGERSKSNLWGIETTVSEMKNTLAGINSQKQQLENV